LGGVAEVLLHRFTDLLAGVEDVVGYEAPGYRSTGQTLDLRAGAETRADVTIAPDGEGFSITGVHLDTHIRVPGADKSQVETAAEQAKVGCPVSKLFTAEISLAVQVET